MIVMVSGQLSSFGRQVRGMMLARDPAVLGDAELVERFVASQDAAAFEALVRRHGPMVLGVCRRVLNDPNDAEDAFQATFVVLLRRIGSLERPQLLANWLYGVAGRTAREARNRLGRRRAREQQAMDLPDNRPADADHWADARPVLDEELERLPEKYRVPVVLCDLQSRSRKQAAEQMGLPEGTVSSRLARARDILRRRLTRRGLSLSTASLAALLAAESTAHALPPALARGTIDAILASAAAPAAAGALSAPVVALSEGVLEAMFATKLKLTTALVLSVALLGVGAGLFTHQVLASAEAQGFLAADQEKPGDKPKAQKPNGDKPDPEKPNRDKPAGEKPNGDKPGAEKPNRDKPGAEKPNGDKPGAEKPNRDKPGAEKPNGDKPRPEKNVGDGVKPLKIPGAQSPTVRGTIKAVDVTKGTITVAAGEGGGEHTVVLPQTVRIFLLAKKDAAIGDLKPGTAVMIQLTADQKSVVAIKEIATDAGRKEGGEGGARPIKGRVAIGIVKEVSAKTVTLTVRGEGRDIDQTFDLGPLRADALKPGERVILQLTADRKAATGVVPFQGEGDK